MIVKALVRRWKKRRASREIARRKNEGQWEYRFRHQVEQLEDKVLLSATLVADINLTNPVQNFLPTLRGADVNGTFFFVANDGARGSELWKNEGAGVVLVRDIVTGAGSSNPSELINV